MKNKLVLVVSHDEDGSAKLLMQRLLEIGQPYQLVNLGLYPHDSFATLEYDEGSRRSFKLPSGEFSSNTVKSVWWRRPRGKVRATTTDPIERYVEIESEIFTNSFFALLDGVRWVSDPESTRVANHKPLQLELARKIGFRIPKTIISNDPVAVSAFIKRHWNMPLIMKPVGTSFVRISSDPTGVDNKNRVIYTRLIDKKKIIESIDMVSNCPVIFQESAEQDFDVRATVIGDTVFAVKITHSQDSGAGENNVDWRNPRLNRKYEKLDLPDSVKKMCVELTRSLNLGFGAIDLCFSEKKGFIFLEINPQGQWVPSETVAGHPVSLTLARFLSEC